ncbi:conserved hypothetical protein, partial [Ricinus communis]
RPPKSGKEIKQRPCPAGITRQPQQPRIRPLRLLLGVELGQRLRLHRQGLRQLRLLRIQRRHFLADLVGLTADHPAAAGQRIDLLVQLVGDPPALIGEQLRHTFRIGRHRRIQLLLVQLEFAAFKREARLRQLGSGRAAARLHQLLKLACDLVQGRVALQIALLQRGQLVAQCIEAGHEGADILRDLGAVGADGDVGLALPLQIERNPGDDALHGVIRTAHFLAVHGQHRILGRLALSQVVEQVFHARVARHTKLQAVRFAARATQLQRIAGAGLDNAGVDARILQRAGEAAQRIVAAVDGDGFVADLDGGRAARADFRIRRGHDHAIQDLPLRQLADFDLISAGLGAGRSGCAQHTLGGHAGARAEPAARQAVGNILEYGQGALQLSQTGQLRLAAGQAGVQLADYALLGGQRLLHACRHRGRQRSGQPAVAGVAVSRVEEVADVVHGLRAGQDHIIVQYNPGNQSAK